jgi:hypothetical protein
MIEGYMDRVKSFYDFMIRRELIRQRRRAGLSMAEWTSDPVLQTFSFTNVKRHHDRTTTLLKQIYDEHVDASDSEKLLNCALYRFFGTVESARAIGWVRSWFNEGLDHVMRIGPMLRFTAAYIVTSAGRSDAKFIVVCEFVSAIANRTDDIIKHQTWEGAVNEMTKCYGVGSFMAKEIYLDFLLATWRVPTDWDTWTPVGPGGRRGASRIRYNIPDKISETEALEVIRDVYALRDEYWPEQIDTGEHVWVLPRLDLTDIQFQFCEYDKYSRVAEGRRPKRLFRPTADSVTQDRCCTYDYNSDGNCHIHSAPGVLRIAQ